MTNDWESAAKVTGWKQKEPFDKAKWQREYMKEYRAGKRRKSSPPKPSIQTTTEERNEE